MGKNAISEIKGNFDLMKKSVSKLYQCWQRFWEHIDKFLFIVVVLLVALAVAVMVSECLACCLQQLIGANNKYDVLKAIGFCITGVLLALQAVAANRRAKEMEGTAKEQAKATVNTEMGQRQERLKNATDHLGHERDSVRISGARELFRLAKETEGLRQAALDILCAHIRQTTGEYKYKRAHGKKPSEEIQSLLTLLFVQEHDVFKGCLINLQDSYLNGADLRWAELQGANLKDARLQKKTDLRYARLQGADLSQAQLQEANLREAQLQGANLGLARMQGANLGLARMQGAKLGLARIQGAKLRYAQLQGAHLSKAQLQGADLRYAQLQGANLKEAQLQNADLYKAQLQNADLYKAQLQGADLRYAQLQGANLGLARMQGANLRYAQLQGANLKEAQLQNADLYKVQLKGVSNQEKYPSGFESNIRKRIGKDSDLTGIFFAGGLQEEDLDTLCEGLSAEKAQELREKLRPHVGLEASNELPPNSGVETGVYTQEEAEQWIVKYNKAMEEVPSADDTADAASTPDGDKDKED